MLGTHVDALAKAAGQENELDSVSLVDFVLNDVVTYPHTAYTRIFQSHPAATQIFEPAGQGFRKTDPVAYWLPEEVNPYSDINQAASVLRDGLQDYVARVTEGMTTVAQFISGGEDSRTLAGLLPKKLKRDAFIFLDSMNREGLIAKQVAEVYDANFCPEFRKKTHYLDILSEATDLIGSGQQYVHAHSLRFHEKCRLNRYDAVFGGYLSDSLLKAAYTKKVRGHGRFPFLPEIFVSGETRSEPLKNLLCNDDILKQIDCRRKVHLEYIQTFRKTSTHEWFVLWPVTMRVAIPNLYSNRRLFRSYEPIMCKQSVKVSASVPTSWKLNRRLFNKMARPFLRPSRWIFHADGRLPYFPWWVNCPVQFVVWFTRQIRTRTGMIKGNQGPWGDWIWISGCEKWREMVAEYSKGFPKIAKSMKSNDIEKIFESKELNVIQKVNLLQVLYKLSRNI